MWSLLQSCVAVSVWGRGRRSSGRQTPLWRWGRRGAPSRIRTRTRSWRSRTRKRRAQRSQLWLGGHRPLPYPCLTVFPPKKSDPTFLIPTPNFEEQPRRLVLRKNAAYLAAPGNFPPINVLSAQFNQFSKPPICCNRRPEYCDLSTTAEALSLSLLCRRFVLKISCPECAIPVAPFPFRM